MKERIVADSQLADVRSFAFQLVDGTEHWDHTGRALRVFHELLLRVRYDNDPASFDLVQPVHETLRLGRGDCDCMTTAFCTLAESVGAKMSLLETPGHVLAIQRIPDEADALRLSRSGVLRTWNDGVHSFWLPYDLALGAAHSLAAETAAAIAEGNFVVHDYG